MPELSFRVERVGPERSGAAPLLLFKLRVAEATGTPVHAAVLRCQVRIEPARRRYHPGEQERLLDLFGTPERWGQALRPLFWTHVGVSVPSFDEAIVVDVPVPCGYDFSLAATKYCAALEGGEIPLCFLFRGTVFYQAEDGRLRVAQVPWDREAYFRLPACTWKELMDLYYPNRAWLCLRRDVFDRLCRYKSRQGLPTWEQALEGLLSAAEGGWRHEPHTRGPHRRRCPLRGVHPLPVPAVGQEPAALDLRRALPRGALPGPGRRGRLEQPD
jgi:hypothetical protein